MSYILEALRKSSEERARVTGAEANSEALPVFTRDESRARHSPRWWLAGLGLGGLTLIALIGIGADPQAPAPAPSPSRSTISAAAPDSVTAAVQLDDTPAPPGITAKPLAPKNPVAANLPDVVAAGAPDQTAPKLAGKPPSPKKSATLAPRHDAAPAQAPAPVPAPDAGAQMPPELLKQVLAIPVSAHIYSSKPAERMIIIEGQAVREGDRLASGMTVEQITPSGIAVSYKGYRANKPNR